MKTPDACPICGRGELQRFLRIDAVPVMTTQLWGDASTADAAPRGDLDLAVCDHCGAIRNLAFDAALVEYTGDYENSQLFSPAFRDYARRARRRARRPVRTAPGHGARVRLRQGRVPGDAVRSRLRTGRRLRPELRRRDRPGRVPRPCAHRAAPAGSRRRHARRPRREPARDRASRGSAACGTCVALGHRRPGRVALSGSARRPVRPQRIRHVGSDLSPRDLLRPRGARDARPASRLQADGLPERLRRAVPHHAEPCPTRRRSNQSSTGKP